MCYLGVSTKLILEYPHDVPLVSYNFYNQKGGFISKDKEFKSVLAHILRHSTMTIGQVTSISLFSRLHVFDNYLFRIEFSRPYFLKEDYETWLKRCLTINLLRLTEKQWTYGKFLTYMCSMGIECYIPRPVKPVKSDFVPYIFSHDEIKRIFKTTDQLRIKYNNSGTVVMALPLLFRILYSTGIRVGECVKIKNEDIDFERHIINLDRQNTKNKCQRLAVMRPSLELAIKQYMECRNKLPIEGIANPKSPLIVSRL